MTGLALLSRADQRVCVALSDDRMAQGLNDLRWHLPTLLWVKRSCQARRVRVVLAGPTDRTLDVLTRTGLASVFEIESRES